MKKSFKQIRKEKGLSVSFVSQRLHRSEATIRNKESGRTEFTAPEARQLCHLYNVSFEEVDF